MWLHGHEGRDNFMAALPIIINAFLSLHYKLVTLITNRWRVLDGHRYFLGSSSLSSVDGVCPTQNI